MHTLTKPVFLVGFMGAGKTSVAQELSRDCEVSAIDLDEEIEAFARKSIAEIFAQDTEKGFRKVESQVLGDIIERMRRTGPAIVSCGGGILEGNPDNLNNMQDAGIIVYLQVSFDEAKRRVAGSDRPLFRDIRTGQKLYVKRQQLYRKVANISVPTTGKTVAEVAVKVREELVTAGLLF